MTDAVEGDRDERGGLGKLEITKIGFDERQAVEDASRARPCLTKLEYFLGRVDADDGFASLGRFDTNAAIADAELDRGSVRFHEALDVDS